ncbi:hypothetical protein [Winogradskyella sediminis]|uniref:hypothetical protein n=1 Tax=Winogradskyella sediminis TaxID=1382466 RepID=UPI000E287A13|nr:hypothetical protein [Winogradskyella sediminis]REG89373.1 hypothetical protein C8N41_101614 [Winogradskyella sediminis]
MGSTGTGNFSDYSSQGSSGNGKTGGTSGENKCDKAFSTMLEEVNRCDYYLTNKTLPSVGDIVNIGFNDRPTAISEGGLIIGYLPTKYNYIKLCMDDGVNYSGRVVRSMRGVIASVSIDVVPV